MAQQGGTAESGTGVQFARASRTPVLLRRPMLLDPAAPALFPYGGFGQCVVSGELAEDGGTFFVRRILSYLPDQRHASFSRAAAPHRLPGRPRRLSRQPPQSRGAHRPRRSSRSAGIRPGINGSTWSARRPASAGHSSLSGKYRHNGGEWQLVRWETALPSRLTCELPSEAQIALAAAKRAYQRFGEHYDAIQRIRRSPRARTARRAGTIGALPAAWHPCGFRCHAILLEAGLRSLLLPAVETAQPERVLSSAANTYFSCRARSSPKSPSWGTPHTFSPNLPTCVNSSVPIRRDLQG